jgi:hypothetical protein
VFCIYLRTNSDLCYLQHKLIGFYNRDGVYSAVRSGSLNKAVYASSLKDYIYEKMGFIRGTDFVLCEEDTEFLFINWLIVSL